MYAPEGSKTLQNHSLKNELKRAHSGGSQKLEPQSGSLNGTDLGYYIYVMVV